MRMSRSCFPAGRVWVLAGVAACAQLGACQQGNIAVDVRNKTPQPLFAQLSERTADGGAVLRARERLGPGDRKVLGPVRAQVGRAFIVLDTMPNETVPYLVDLRPGTTLLEVTQEGAGTKGALRVRLLGGSEAR